MPDVSSRPHSGPTWLGHCATGHRNHLRDANGLRRSRARYDEARRVLFPLKAKEREEIDDEFDKLIRVVT